MRRGTPLTKRWLAMQWLPRRWRPRPRRPTARRRRRRWTKHLRNPRRLAIAGLLIFGLGAYWLTRSEPPPREPGDICAIFTEKRHWYRAARRSFEAWEVPEAVQLAIIHQESGFRERVRPPRRKLWWILPGRRPSSAYGYAQAIDSTWAQFQGATGRTDASRHDFGDVAWFVGWYGDQIHRQAGVARDDARNLYLGYHEGPAGYRRGTHRDKAWLLDVARKVEARAGRYQRQYDGCAERLRRDWRWLLWLVAAIGVLLAWRAIRHKRPRRRA